MLKFTTASIGNGTLQVTGPAEGDPGMEVKQVRFTVAQGDVMVEDDASVSERDGRAEAADSVPCAPDEAVSERDLLAVRIKASKPIRASYLVQR